MAHKKFEERMLNHLLPQFCSNPLQGWTQEGFKQEWHKICDQDAIDFLRGLDGGLIKHVGHGLYLAPKMLGKRDVFLGGR